MHNYNRDLLPIKTTDVYELSTHLAVKCNAMHCIAAFPYAVAAQHLALPDLSGCWLTGYYRVH